MKKIIFLIIVYRLLHPIYAHKIYLKMRCLMYYQSGKVNGKLVWFLRNLFGYLKDMKPEELQILINSFQ